MNQSKKKVIPASRKVRSAPSLKAPAAAKKRKSKINAAEALKQEKNGLEVINDIPNYIRNGWESIPPNERDRLKWGRCLLPETDTGGIYDASPNVQRFQ